MQIGVLVTAEGLHVRLTGAVSLTAGGQPAGPHHIGSLQARVVMALLVIERARPVHRDELVEVLWGDRPPSSWESVLRTAVAKVRAAFDDAGVDGRSAIRASASGYQLRLPPGSTVDLDDAADGLQEAFKAVARGRRRQAIDLLEVAAGILGRPFLPDSNGEWVRARRTEQVTLRVRVLELLAESSLTAGLPAEAVSSARQAIGLDPFRESSYRILMAAYTAGGNRAQALVTYEQCRLLLATELGVDPSPETETMYIRLLRAETRPELSSRVVQPTDRTSSTADADTRMPKKPLVEPQLKHFGKRSAGNVKLTRIWGIPAQLIEFTGRDQLLDDLHATLRNGSRVTVNAVHGIGGVGKTTTAIEYAHRFSEEYDITWWIPAEDPVLIPERMADLARALNLASPKDTASVALARLAGALRERPHWLLIFDNAEDPGMLTRFLPGGHGHVIITSRNPDWGGIAMTLGIDDFTRTESVTLLQSRLPQLHDRDADRLAAALGDLPQAVDQAAALIAHTGLNVDSYLGLLADRTEEALAQGVGQLVPGGPSWAVAFSRPAADEPAGMQLLALSAWLSPAPIPISLITDHPDQLPEPLSAVARDPLAFAACTATLRRRGMARITPGSIQLHRVPSAILRAHTSSQEFRDRHQAPEGGWAVAVIHLLRKAVPDDPWNRPAVWPVWRALLPHVLVATAADRPICPETDVIWLLCKAGEYLQTRGEPRAARPLLERAYQLSNKRPDADGLHSLTSANAFTGVLNALGEFEKARQLGADTLTRHRPILGEDDADVLVAATNLAVSLGSLGHHEQARQIDDDTLTRSRRILGEDHSRTLLSARHVADDLYALGHHEQARQLNDDVLARYRRTLGDDHPDTLHFASQLAVTLTALGPPRTCPATQPGHCRSIATRARRRSSRHPSRGGQPRQQPDRAWPLRTSRPTERGHSCTPTPSTRTGSRRHPHRRPRP